MEDPCLLGLDYLACVEACVDLQRGRMTVRGHEVPLILGEHAPVAQSQGKEANVVALQETVPRHLEDLVHRSVKHLTSEQARRVQQLLNQFADVFSQRDMDLGRTLMVKHHIYTSDTLPIKQLHRRVPPAKREEMQCTIREMAEAGIIERSNSSWCSPVVLVTKKDGSKRFCVDYRALNAVTVTDAYPLPRIDDNLDALIKVQWFSTLDLKSGYYQVEMAKEDKEKTAFSFGQGMWHFNVMPFGLCNAPGCFERLIEQVLEGLQWKVALIYLDDVLVFGNTFEEELEHLTEVLCRFKAANLKLSPKKCTFFHTEVPFLGHVVDRQGVRMDPLKVSAMVSWPVPRTVAELRSFLGLCTYYRRFVQGFATIAAPLYQLTRKGASFVWDEACHQTFVALKQALVEAPVLPYPDPSLPYIIDTDASQEGVGAVLSQLKDGQEYVVAYCSCKFSKPERNYWVTRKELAAVMKGLSHFHHYLYGAQFTIRTDHAALRWLKALKEPEGQLARWLGKLEKYNYQVVHRAGCVHSNADSLSRRPFEPDCNHCFRRESEITCWRLIVSESIAEADKR
ncbi:hypothetical protein C7M84_000488 [Penaeus vannamei]|uniref:RNA-directed DNA polymerase n=1 Tax=Penaeus vannamei TaxID=6689 RepID=A0A423TWF2_PENVA|nr:hypothetical protein C7M84_000488 [Penaeus vannamei]